MANATPWPAARTARFAALAAVPASWALARFGGSPVLVFVVAGVGIAVLADWIRRGTEDIAARTRPSIGGLLNVTLGNVAELILALFVLRTGAQSVVKATITGSIIGNGLLGLGLAVLAGSWGRVKQTFQPERAGLLASLLTLSVLALLIPALFDYTERQLWHEAAADTLDEQFSLGAAVVLILAYLANLAYTLVTHRDVFAPRPVKAEQATGSPWPAVGILALATAAVALEAALISDALGAAADGLGLTPFFLGIVVLPLVGNAAEYVAAIYFARRDRMNLVLSVAVGSSIQIALFTAPILVLVSYAIGHPMTLVFDNPLELVAVASVAFTVNAIASDGETTWFEGVLLLAVYALLALAFFYVRV